MKISNVSKRHLRSWPSYSMTLVLLLLFCFTASYLNSAIQMSVLVEQQDETLNKIDAEAENVVRDTEAG